MRGIRAIGPFYKTVVPILCQFGLLLLLNARDAALDGEREIEPDTDDFGKLRGRLGMFIDKSMFIDEFLRSDDKATLITRPKGWGRTTNLNMLKRFLELEANKEGEIVEEERQTFRSLFVGGKYEMYGMEPRSVELTPLKIASSASSMKHRGQHPVLMLNLTGITGNTFQKIADKIRNKVSNLYNRYAYLRSNMRPYEREEFAVYSEVSASNEQLEISLQHLSGLLKAYFNRTVYVFIDEYDAPINNLFHKLVQELLTEQPDLNEKDAFKKAASSKELKLTMALIHFIICNSMKDNDALEKGLITGTLHIYSHDWFMGGLTNVAEYSILDRKYSEFYGFNENDVDSLLKQVPDVKVNREGLKMWYSYNFSGYEEAVIYHPWSVIQCLANGGKLSSDYWHAMHSRRTATDIVLESDDMQEKLQNLADGKIASKEVGRKTEYDLMERQFYNLLLFHGYFNPERDTVLVGNWMLSVPNVLIQTVLEQKIVAWFCKQTKITVEELLATARYLPDGKMKEFEEKLREYISTIPVSVTKKYKYYNGIVKSLVYMLLKEYEIIDMVAESESAKAYIVMVPKPGTGHNTAIAIQYKMIADWSSLQTEAENVLGEITSNTDEAKLKQNQQVKQVNKIGLVFWNHRFGIQHRIDALK